MSAADPTIPLRFKVGTRVECNTGSWTPGVVVQIYYSEPHWPAGRIVPYQIKLDDGRLIFAPMDDDRVIREVPKTPIHDALDHFDVELLRELCGGGGGAAAAGAAAAPSIFLNRPNFKGEPPIIYLLSSEKFEDVDDEKQELVLQMAAVLKDSGCALGTCNMQGSNVLHCAAVRGSVKLMRLVLEWQKEPKYALDLDEQNMEGSEYTEGEWSIVEGDSRYLTEEQKEQNKSQPNYYNDTVRCLLFVVFFCHILFFFFLFDVASLTSSLRSSFLTFPNIHSHTLTCTFRPKNASTFFLFF